MTYLKISQRSEAVSEIENGLKAIAQSILKRNNRYKIREIKSREGILQKIAIVDGLTSIKNEPNFTLSETLLPVVKMGIQSCL